MATFSKLKLSGSTDCRGIKVTGTDSSTLTTIHTAVSGTSDFDELWVYAVNTDTVDIKLSLLYGDTTDPDDYIEYTVGAEDGLKLIIPGLLLNNSKILKAFAGTANKIVMHGYVNRITA